MLADMEVGAGRFTEEAQRFGTDTGTGTRMTEGTAADWVSGAPARAGSGEHTSGTCITLVGGQRIVRDGIAKLLTSRGIKVTQSPADEEELARSFEEGGNSECRAVVLILPGVGPFRTFRRIHDALHGTGHAVPLVVLSERASRGQIYTALRIGAKAYVNLDADPEELIKAIEMAAQQKVYLSPDAAELLVNDISAAITPSRRSRLPRTDLSRREVEIVQLLCEGLSSKEMARHLHISAKTVENHRYNIYRKCEVDSIACLMRYAIQHGMIAI